VGGGVGRKVRKEGAAPREPAASPAAPAQEKEKLNPGSYSESSPEPGSAVMQMKRSRGQSRGALQQQRSVRLPARRQARASA
jgi:hypothetical protein